MALDVAGLGVVAQDPGPTAIRRRLEQTARDIGAAGYDRRYGFGLIDAAAATARPQYATPVRSSG